MAKTIYELPRDLGGFLDFLGGWSCLPLHVFTLIAILFASHGFLCVFMFSGVTLEEMRKTSQCRAKQELKGRILGQKRVARCHHAMQAYRATQENWSSRGQ